MYFSLCESLLENSLADLLFIDSSLNNWLYSTPSSYYTYSICSCGKPSSSSSFKFNPNINLSEDDQNYYIHVDLPGMTKDQITLDLNQEDRILTISGERIAPNTNDNGSDVSKNENENENEDKNVKDNNTTDNDIASTSTSTSNNDKEKKSQENDKRKYIQKESHYGSFSRSFSLPENIHFDRIQANMENGVLRIIMAKLESPKSKSRLIQIE